jgi:hypothetical protein
MTKADQKSEAGNLAITGMLHGSDQTPDKLKAGVKVPVELRTTIQLVSPSIEILVGGPYKAEDGIHPYGHMALRVSTSKEEKIYDFGRYGDTEGEYSATGEGIFRLWKSFDSYIASENSYGRTTKGFAYGITEEQGTKIFAHYAAMTAGKAKRRSSNRKVDEEYKLSKDYHAVTNNCATMTLSGARIAMPNIERNSAKYNEGRGLSDAKKAAARVSHFGFWPSHIFMPGDVQAMLEGEKEYIPKATKVYGANIK